jgi:hypothetical protein
MKVARREPSNDAIVLGVLDAVERNLCRNRMTYGRSHLLMPRLVARIRIMAHRLASAYCDKTEEPR